MPALLSPRSVFFLLFLGTVFAMLFAVLFLQQHLGLAPCPLCVTQRGFMILTGLANGVGSLSDDFLRGLCVEIIAHQRFGR